MFLQKGSSMLLKTPNTLHKLFQENKQNLFNKLFQEATLLKHPPRREEFGSWIRKHKSPNDTVRKHVTVSTFSHHHRVARKSWWKASRVITRMTTAKLSLLISEGKGRSFPGRPVISHSLNSSQAIKVEGSEELEKKTKHFILYIIHKQCHLKGLASHLKSTRGIQPPQWAYSLVSNKRDTSLKFVLFCFKPPSPTASYYQTMFTGLPQLTHLVWIFWRGQLPKIAFQSWSYSRKKCPKKLHFTHLKTKTQKNTSSRFKFSKRGLCEEYLLTSLQKYSQTWSNLKSLKEQTFRFIVSVAFPDFIC